MIFLFPLGKGDTSRGDGRQTHCDGKPLQSFLLLNSSLSLFSPSFCLLLGPGGGEGRVNVGGWVREVGGGGAGGGGR